MSKSKTIYAVAQRAGVSIATVSRVLNNSPRVREATRQRVQLAMQELGYRPSASARGLALSATETIALIFPRVSHPFYVEILRGVEDRASALNYHLLLYSTGDGPIQDHLYDMLPSKADGLILSDHCVSDDHVAALHAQGVPLTLVGREVVGMEVDSVRPANRSGSRAATTHLLEHGYQHVAMIAGPPESRHSQGRIRGYREALDAIGLPFDPSLLVNGDFHEASGQEQMARLLDLEQPPRAVFVANDNMAVGAIQAVRERDLRVPEDVALIGFDDLEIARFVRPALTTVRQSLYDLGAEAVSTLVRRINEPDAPPLHVVLPTELVIRDSCGCS